MTINISQQTPTSNLVMTDSEIGAIEVVKDNTLGIVLGIIGGVLILVAGTLIFLVLNRNYRKKKSEIHKDSQL